MRPFLLAELAVSHRRRPSSHRSVGAAGRNPGRELVLRWVFFARPRGDDLLSFAGALRSGPLAAGRPAEAAGCLEGEKEPFRVGCRLSLWQSHLTELTTEQREAEKLRQEGEVKALGSVKVSLCRTRPACAASS